MRTYLQLVNDFIDEYGVGGGGPLADVTGQTGDLGRACRWVREAHTYVCNLWIDWRFLWKEWEDVLPAGSATPTLPTVGGAAGYEFAHWDRNFFYLSYGESSFQRLRFQDWEIFRHQTPGVVGTDRPTIITELPNRVLRTNTLADQEYPFFCQGWKRPTEMEASGDTPDIPGAFDRIIIVRAAIAMANKDDAPEWLEGAEAEYIDLLEKLESNELPGQEYSRRAAQDRNIEVEVPGASISTVTR